MRSLIDKRLLNVLVIGPFTENFCALHIKLFSNFPLTTYIHNHKSDCLLILSIGRLIHCSFGLNSIKKKPFSELENYFLWAFLLHFQHSSFEYLLLFIISIEILVRFSFCRMENIFHFFPHNISACVANGTHSRQSISVSHQYSMRCCVRFD